MKPTPNDINLALKSIERSELPDQHPRKLAVEAIARYRRGTAIDHFYDFSCAPVELRQNRLLTNCPLSLQAFVVEKIDWEVIDGRYSDGPSSSSRGRGSPTATTERADRR